MGDLKAETKSQNSEQEMGNMEKNRITLIGLDDKMIYTYTFVSNVLFLSHFCLNRIKYLNLSAV